MNAFGKLMEDKLGIQSVYCIDHLFHNIAKLAFDDINIDKDEKLMKRCWDLCAKFTSSSQLLSALKDIQKNNETLYPGLKRALGVVQDVITRWWSTFNMIQRLRKLKPALHVMVSQGTSSSKYTNTNCHFMIL